MTRKTKDTGARHTASSVQVEERLAARHIDYRFEPNFGIERIIDADGHQVRLIQHRAPADMVARYAQQMRAGAVFPAIVVNERGELIDGNTRRRAAVKVGRSTIPAYICRAITPLHARSLSIELNQANGLPMDEKEIHEYVRSATRDGQALDTKMFARITGVKPAALERWKAQAQFERRAKRCDIREVDLARLSESVQVALNGIRLTPVLIEATALAAAARMPASAVRTMVTQINAATSEGDALAVVAAERAARRDDIRAIATGFAARKRSGHRSTMHIAALLKIPVPDLLCVPPDKRMDLVQRLRALRDHVDEALTAAASQRSDEVETSNTEVPLTELCAQGSSRG
jgi:hypothetical protein